MTGGAPTTAFLMPGWVLTYMQIQSRFFVKWEPGFYTSQPAKESKRYDSPKQIKKIIVTEIHSEIT
jgi:hypothetical protein